MFRKSKESDCKFIYELMCELEQKQLPYLEFEKIYRQQLKSEDMYSFVKVEGHKIIAFLNLRFEKQLHHCETIAEIMEFVVASAYRNMGIGKAMFQEANLIALSRGCNQIEVACNQLRNDTHRFYAREGMRNFHYKFSKNLVHGDCADNVLGL